MSRGCLQTGEDCLQRWRDIGMLVDALPGSSFPAKDVGDAQLKGDRLSSDCGLHRIGADHVGQVRADSETGTPPLSALGKGNRSNTFFLKCPLLCPLYQLA